jgi:hypothetical protein
VTFQDKEQCQRLAKFDAASDPRLFKFKRFKDSPRNSKNVRLQGLMGGRERGVSIHSGVQKSTLLTAYLEYDGKLWETDVL